MNMKPLTSDQALSDSNVGARKGRNVRDNIFVVNAVTNSVINGNEDPIDVQVYDVEKCFDALWVQECINDLADTGLANDKLPLLYLENQNARISVKTPSGSSERISVTNIVMQGTVWGSLFCTVSMEKLGKQFYQNQDLTYKYKQAVEIPSLGMVDDILTIQKCSNESVKINSVVNGFIETKKLTLNDKKCHRIHIQKQKNNRMECKRLKVHEKELIDSDKEKYLGDIINKAGNIKDTIQDRKNKGLGIVSEICAILNDIPLGKHKLEIGLSLRQAMLINSMLFNCEAWHAIKEKDVRILESVDEHLLRSIVGAHSKTPLEFLYLESGAMPLRFIIASRRMSYQQTLLKRNDDELTKKIYKAQKDNPIEGDFYNLVKADWEMIGKEMDEEYIATASKDALKRHIKESIKASALKYLKEKQKMHSKIKDIEYKKLEVQGYMTSPLFSDNEVSLLYALRSRAVVCKMNYRNKYKEDDLLCILCKEESDSQPHILLCRVLQSKLESIDLVAHKVNYNDIFEDTLRQKVIVTIFEKLLTIRETLMKLNPSTLQGVLENNCNLRTSSVNYSFGK